jgi:L-threonylcarbamoyladenylate synthase
MILYPTETIYGLGVNALDDKALAVLFALKGRDEHQTVSWLVRNIHDIAYYAVLSPQAERLVETFLPGPLTLVLPAKSTVPAHRSAPDNTIGIRMSSDPIAQKLIEEYMAETNAPLTCTSANVSGLPPLPTPAEIQGQFGEKASLIEKVIDDGPRYGAPSTVVRVIGETVEILRTGSVPESEIQQALA